MTDLKRSIFAIPSHSLDDLPKQMGSQAALDFLTAWTAQWDPRLIHAFQSSPEWKRADGSSLDVEQSLILVPEIAKSHVDRPLRERLELNQCTILESGNRSRSEIVSSLLQALKPGASKGEPAQHESGSPLWIEDFYALGYATLQIQILARKLHYSSNIDWIVFHDQLLSAARASLEGNAEDTERWIQACFDSISQERDRYCSQQAYLLDVVLLAETTLMKRLDDQLDREHPFNVIATASLLDSLRSKNDNAWGRLCERIQGESIGVVGGLREERFHPYLTLAGLHRDLARGQRAYRELEIDPPKVFTRFSPGMCATLPTHLNQFGYRGVLMANWSSGVLPEKDQAKIRWQASESAPAIDCVLGHVLDASNAESYLYLATELSKQLDYHHVPTLVFAHWPDALASPFDDLVRCMRRTPALGKFTTIENYFTTTGHPYSNDTFVTSAFKSPVPQTPAEQNELLLRLQSYACQATRAERLRSNFWLWKSLTQFAYPKLAAESEANQHSIEALEADVDRLTDDVFASLDNRHGLSEQVRNVSNEHLRGVAKCLVKDEAWWEAKHDPSKPQAWLLVNPSGHTRRYFLENLPGTIDGSSNQRIYACKAYGGSSKAVIDVPPFGFIKFRSTGQGQASSVANDRVSTPGLWKRLAGGRTGIAKTDWTLANEFLEIQIDPRRGHLRSVYVANKRGSRMSGMLSLVPRPLDVRQAIDTATLIELEQIELSIIENSDVCGTIEVRGLFKLGDSGVCRGITRYTLWKGARWVDIQIEVDGQDPSRCFPIWRTAWQNEGATIACWMHGSKVKLNSPLQSAVELIEIDDAENRLYLAPHGLAAHRRLETRFLATYLPIESNGTATTRLSLGVDWQRPYDTAHDAIDPPLLVATGNASATSTPQDLDHAWMAQCNLSNVTFYWTDPSPVLEVKVPEMAAHASVGNQRAEAAVASDEASVSAETVAADTSRYELESGHPGDACLLAFETQGKAGTARFSFFRDVAEAWRVDSQGREFDTLTVSDGQIQMNMRANDCARILIRWKA